MARFLKRKTKNGWSYTATVRIKGHPSVSRTFDTKGEAVVWAAKTTEKIKAHKYNDPRLALQVTLKKALDKYLVTISNKKAPNTHAREKVAAKRLLEKIGPEYSIGSISPAVAAKYRDARLKEVSAYPVRAELALLSHLFTKAKREWGIPVDNPVAEIERPAPPRGRTRFLTADEATKLLDACRKARNKKFYFYILTLLHTGMRASEAAGLRWNQVNLKERIIFLADTKNKDSRCVPLTRKLNEELSTLKQICNAKEDNLVFLRDDQLKTDRARSRPGIKFRESFNAAKKRAGLPDIHMHDLRHYGESYKMVSG